LHLAPQFLVIFNAVIAFLLFLSVTIYAGEVGAGSCAPLAIRTPAVM
jgi:hypothetical protein